MRRVGRLFIWTVGLRFEGFCRIQGLVKTYPRSCSSRRQVKYHIDILQRSPNLQDAGIRIPPRRHKVSSLPLPLTHPLSNNNSNSAKYLTTHQTARLRHPQSPRRARTRPSQRLTSSPSFPNMFLQLHGLCRRSEQVRLGERWVRVYADGESYHLCI